MKKKSTEKLSLMTIELSLVVKNSMLMISVIFKILLNSIVCFLHISSSYFQVRGNKGRGIFAILWYIFFATIFYFLNHLYREDKSKLIYQTRLCFVAALP